MELRLATDAETADDILASALGRADFRGCLMGRLAASPGAACVQRDEHRES